MLDDNSATVRGVVWSEVLPWLAIFRTFRIAVGIRALVPAVAGMVLMFAGWMLIGYLLGAPEDAGAELSVGAQPLLWASPTPVNLERLDAAVPSRPLQSVHLIGVAGMGLGEWLAMSPLTAAWHWMTRPFLTTLSSGGTVQSMWIAILSGLWALVVWALFGGAIARMAAVGLATGDRVGLASAMRFAARKWVSLVFAPLMPVIGIILCAVPIAILGLLMGADVSAIIAAVLWPLALLAALVMALLAVGLIFGWPLMAATIATEGTDAFDALSRSYAYVFQRPLHYLFYAVVAALLGLAGWLLVASFAAGVITLSEWSVAWTVTDERMRLLAGQSAGSRGEIEGIATGLFAFWTGCVKAIALSFQFAFFWAVAACLYLLLRRDVDSTEMDEVYFDEDATEETYGLPPMKTDETGAPEVDDVDSKQ
jgi:hypothetical protein